MLVVVELIVLAVLVARGVSVAVVVLVAPVVLDVLLVRVLLVVILGPLERAVRVVLVHTIGREFSYDSPRSMTRINN